MRYHLFIQAQECCANEACPGNGKVIAVLVTHHPDNIARINPSLSHLADCDGAEAENLKPLPLDTLIPLYQAAQLTDLELLEGWWAD